MKEIVPEWFRAVRTGTAGLVVERCNVIITRDRRRATAASRQPSLAPAPCRCGAKRGGGDAERCRNFRKTELRFSGLHSVAGFASIKNHTKWYAMEYQTINNFRIQNKSGYACMPCTGRTPGDFSEQGRSITSVPGGAGTRKTNIDTRMPAPRYPEGCRSY
jgi:hypothetical protein